MNSLFGTPDSYLGGNDEDLPLVRGAVETLLFGSDTPELVLFCATCEKRYVLPEVIDDVRLLEMCPCCADLSGGADEAQEPAALSYR
jgi:hypothetical protein